MMRRRLIPLAWLMVFSVATADQVLTNTTEVPHDDGGREPLLTIVPVYPEKARRARLEGAVQVCFNVSREGKTSRVAVRSSTNRVFERPSRNAVKASTYRPLKPGENLSGIKTCRTFQFVLTPVAVEVTEKAAD